MIPYINKSSQEPININMQYMKIYIRKFKEILYKLHFTFTNLPISISNSGFIYGAFQVALLVKNSLNSFF